MSQLLISCLSLWFTSSRRKKAVTRLRDSVASTRYANAPTVDMSTASFDISEWSLRTGSVALDGSAEFRCRGRNGTNPSTLPADSQIPKNGVMTTSPRCHRPPSAGKRRHTSFEVRLVFHLDQIFSLGILYPLGEMHTQSSRSKICTSSPSALWELTGWCIEILFIPVQVEYHPKHSSPLFLFKPV